MILSCFGILIIGVLSLTVVVPTVLITQFQVSVTYMIACSLIVTGPLQLAFTRFVSDRLFEERDDLVISNYRAVQLACTVASGLIAVVAMGLGFQAEPLGYRVLMIAGFVIATTRENDHTFDISTSAARELLGTIYIPSAKLLIDGGSSKVADESAWTVIVAKALEMHGSPNLVVNANYAGSPTPVPAGVGPSSSVRLTQ